MVLKLLILVYVLWLVFIICKNGFYNYINDIKDHINKIFYTSRHKRAYLITQRKFKPNHITIRGVFHDIDKLIMLILSIIFCPYISNEDISRIHKMLSRHHKRAKTDKDFYYQIIDYECAKMTKPDKPLGARDFIGKKYITKKIDDNTYNRYCKIMDDIGIEKDKGEKE